MAADRWYYAVYRTNKVMSPRPPSCGHEHPTLDEAKTCLVEQEKAQGNPLLKVFRVHAWFRDPE